MEQATTPDVFEEPDFTPEEETEFLEGVRLGWKDVDEGRVTPTRTADEYLSYLEQLANEKERTEQQDGSSRSVICSV